jgi:hypothetical protein
MTKFEVGRKLEGVWIFPLHLSRAWKFHGKATGADNPYAWGRW